MNPKQKSEVESRLKSIASNTISQDLIKLLLIELREYIPGDTLTKEIAHFVAHPDRDRGIIHGSVTYFYCQICVFVKREEWLSKLDVKKLPFEVFHVIKGYYTYLQKDESFVSKFSKIYKYHRGDNAYNLVGTFEKKFAAMVEKAVTIIAAEPVISGDKMVEDICKSLKGVGLGKYESEVMKVKSVVILCLLTILHRSSFGLVEGKTGTASIDLGYSSKNSLQYLSLNAIVPIEGGGASAAFSMIETSLGKEYLSKRILDHYLDQDHLKLGDKNLKVIKEEERFVLDLLDS